MGEILEQQGRPVLCSRPDGKEDGPLVDLAPDLDRIALGVDGDRLSLSSSAILGHLRLRGPDMHDFIARILPFGRIDGAIDRRWPALPGDERRVELDVGEALVLELRRIDFRLERHVHNP